jgi:UDP-N-acetylmuramyl tripeptide synthase
VSWIWDVDFEQLSEFPYPIIVSGDRAYDMAVRIAYIKNKKRTKPATPALQVYEDSLVAIEQAVAAANDEETVWVLATYSAMLDVRKIITGKKIL